MKKKKFNTKEHEGRKKWLRVWSVGVGGGIFSFPYPTLPSLPSCSFVL
jgi:hypothetical protein